MIGNNFKRIVLGIFIILLIFPTVSCKKDDNKITLLLEWVPNTNHTGLYAAQGLGCFEDEGLDVEILQGPEGGAAQLVAAGQAEFGLSHQEEMTYARVEDIPVVAIAAVVQHNTSGFASPVEKGIKTPGDFEGKKYGGWGSPDEEAILRAIMDKYDADFDKLEMVSIGAADFFTSVTRDVDFTWIYYGWDGIAAELRGIELNFINLREEEKALDFYTPVIITSEDIIKEDPELVKKFLRAVTKGYEYAIANPEKAAEFLLKASPELDRELVMESQKYLSREYQSDAKAWGLMKRQVWEDYAKWLFDRGLIKNMIDAHRVFTNEFLPGE